MRARGGRAAAGALAVLATLVVPTGWAAGGAEGATPGPVATPVKAPFSGHGSIDEAYELGAVPGTHLVLYDAAGRAVGKGVADRYGSLIVPSLRPGPGYRFGAVTGGTVQKSAPFKVLSVDDTPPESFYADQHLSVGLNYITMRDGVVAGGDGAAPTGQDAGRRPVPDRNRGVRLRHRRPPQPHRRRAASERREHVGPTRAGLGHRGRARLVAPLLGFATISLQMRGTGCSGGAFDLFDLPTTYDGYDAVQIAAAQPWVANHKVGMVGISFSGISQMFVAGTRPPGLAAIAPMSLTDDLYSTGFPGGIFNSGFAGSWLAQRQADAEPAPAGGEAYAKVLIEDGDKQCLANQALHGQTQNIQTLLQQASHRDPSLYEQRAPSTWAKRVDVPCSCPGPSRTSRPVAQWPSIIGDLSHDPDVWATITNGTHIDSLGPGTITRWLEFLDLYVADQVPTPSSTLTSLAPGACTKRSAGAPSGPVSPVGYTDEPNLAAARAAFDQQPRVRVLFDNGGPAARAREPCSPSGARTYSSWPPPQARATTLALGAGGAHSGRAGPCAAHGLVQP